MNAHACGYEMRLQWREHTMSEGLSFFDAGGLTWEVREVTAELADDEGELSAAPPRRNGLYFFSRADTRKLSDYPPDWAELPWQALRSLCERARSLSEPRESGEVNARSRQNDD
jgi:hypothetical protein